MRSCLAILTYNRLHALNGLMEGLGKHCSAYPTAIFEDCGQRDGTETHLAQSGKSQSRKELLADEYKGSHLGPNVQVFLGTTNLGVTGNSNRALRWFWETGCDHLCLLNDDLFVLGDFVNFYARGHEDLEVGLFCFCDFDRASPAISGAPETYRWVTVNSRGYRVKLLPRMTGIMMSLTRAVVERIGYFDARFGRFGEEHPCPSGAPVWMGDYTFKPIGEVGIGDEVMGWEKRTVPAKRYGKEKTSQIKSFACDALCKARVTHIRRLEMETVKVTFKSGRSLVCAPEHTWLNYHGVKAGNQKYISAQVGRTLVHVVAPQKVEAVTDDYALGYIHGLVAGDGGIDHGAIIQRTTRPEILQRLHAYLDRFKLRYVVSEWDYAAVKPAKRRFTQEGRVLHLTRITASLSFIEWCPVSDDSWRGWLAGIYDAEGYGRSFGQCPATHPDVYENISDGLKRFGFKVTPQKHQIYLVGGWRELVRFWNICRPTLSYKLDEAVCLGRFKTPDKVVAIEPAGKCAVYCLTTTTGNYVVQGYASKNCDYTIRARLAGFINLDGQMQNCLDLDPAPQTLLKHQDVETSMGGIERKALDKQAAEIMGYVAKRYGQEPLYRPFYLRLPKIAAGHTGVGIPTENLTQYALVDAPA